MRKYYDAAHDVYNETKTALQTVYDALNQGQQKKIMKDEAVAELFERYEVVVTE